MATLLKPSDCIVLIVERDGDFDVEGRVDAGIAHGTRILKAAAVCGIPTFRAAQGTANVGVAPAAGNPLLPDPPHHSHSTKASAWADTPLGAALAASDRSSLLLGGYWLDECVTFTALNALAEGYDVYLLTDASPPLDVNERYTAILRLVQAGVVPTTTKQAIREWAADIADASQRGQLIAIL